MEEHEDAAAQRILSQDLTPPRRQRLKTPTHVRRKHRYEHPNARRPRPHDDSPPAKAPGTDSTASTRRDTACGSKSADSRIRRPPEDHLIRRLGRSGHMNLEGSSRISGPPSAPGPGPLPSPSLSAQLALPPRERRRAQTPRPAERHLRLPAPRPLRRTLPSFPRKRESTRGRLCPAARPSTARTIAHLRPHPRKSGVAQTRRRSQDAYEALLAGRSVNRQGRPSMGPRSYERGNAGRGRGGYGTWPSFNGAAFLRTRKHRRWRRCRTRNCGFNGAAFLRTRKPWVGSA